MELLQWESLTPRVREARVIELKQGPLSERVSPFVNAFPTIDNRHKMG